MDIKKVIDISHNFHIFRKGRMEQIAKNGDNYNIFSVLRIKNDEVRHSAFIADLLSPKGLHGQGILFLKTFFETVLPKYKLSDKQLSMYVSRREYHIGAINKDYTEGGNIDILLKPKQVEKMPMVIIENKIYANDQPNQLLRYSNYAQIATHGFFEILYLTLDGKEASTDANIELKYRKISYRSDIMSWLNKCLSFINDKPQIKVVIMQYIRTLKSLLNIRNNNMNTEQKIIDILQLEGKSSEETINTLNNECKEIEELLKAIKNIRQLKRKNWLVGLAKRLAEDNGEEFIDYFCGENKKHPEIKGCSDKWPKAGVKVSTKAFGNIIVLLEYNIDGEAPYYGIRMSKQEKNPNRLDSNSIHAKLQKVLLKTETITLDNIPQKESWWSISCPSTYEDIEDRVSELIDVIKNYDSNEDGI